MKITKSRVAVGIASSAALMALATSGVAMADTSSTSNGQTSLITKIAQKFNLKEADVQAVFDEDHAAHEAEMQKNLEDKLTQAVTDGKLTNEQKDKIVAKMKEVQADMEANRDSMQDKTDDERKAAMDAKRTELEQWAKDNNIPTEYLRMIGGHGHGGPGGRGHGGPEAGTQSSSN